MLPGEKLSAPAMKIKWAGPKAGPFQGRQATEVNFAGASEASGGPCGEFFLSKKLAQQLAQKGQDNVVRADLTLKSPKRNMHPKPNDPRKSPRRAERTYARSTPNPGLSDFAGKDIPFE